MDTVINQPIVSIIMPAYNASNHIQEAIDSVLTQTFLNWELIIIDDGSIDTTASVIKKNINCDKRIRSFYQENGRQGKARNLGIYHAKGKYLAFLDSDDIWLRDKLEIQLDEIINKDVDLVFSDSYTFSDKNTSYTGKKMRTIHGVLKGKDAIMLFLQGNRIPILTVLAKKEKIVSVGSFSEKKEIQNAEDYHLWLKLLFEECVFFGSNKTLAAYRNHENSATNNDRMAFTQIPEVFCDLMKTKNNSSPLILKALKNRFQNQYGNLHKKSDIVNIVEVNCHYLKKNQYISFFKLLLPLVGRKITIKVLRLLLNG